MRRAAYPCLSYADADAGIRWLTGTLGFTEHQVYRDETGTVVHAELLLDDAMIMMGADRDGHPSDPGFSSPKGSRPTAAVYIAVDDPDALWQRATAAGAEVVRELHDTDYGSRDFSVRDPEGHLWSFGTYRP